MDDLGTIGRTVGRSRRLQRAVHLAVERLQRPRERAVARRRHQSRGLWSVCPENDRFPRRPVKGCHKRQDGRARGLKTRLETTCQDSYRSDGFPDTTMLVGYARISTRDQSPALQRHALEAAGCERLFEETASGARRDRPQLAKALDYMREGDTLVVWRLDRLARSTRQLIETVEDLGDRGVGFRSLTETIDTTSSSGRLVFQIFGAIAEFERALIRERTRAGLDAARAHGRVGGRPPGLDARGKAVAGALLLDPSIPVREVAQQVGVSKATLYKYFPGGRCGIEESGRSGRSDGPNTALADAASSKTGAAREA